ncbi:MAG TPA: hypothetical protein VN736_21190 [Candidatus Limnocylindrales bacterium]|nr:hypothetical protein [Candidatus Limnocylindrales bacterium]
MKAHLTGRQVDSWLCGDATAEMEAHARECAECREQVQRLSATLRDFRAAAVEFSESQGGEAAPAGWSPAESRGFRIPSLRWAAAAAAVLVLTTAVPLYRSAQERRQAEAAAEAAKAARADSLLLQEVDYEISRAVPAPMEPLVALMARPNRRGNPQRSQQGN